MNWLTTILKRPDIGWADAIDIAIVSFRASSHMVFFAGNVPQADLMKLADAVAEPLYSELVRV